VGPGCPFTSVWQRAASLSTGQVLTVSVDLEFNGLQTHILYPVVT
jgi:hypothetical protein